MKNKLILLGIFLLLTTGVALALTADDYFDAATTKYLLGNQEGAVTDLEEALKLDPNHRGAIELLSTIQTEMRIKEIEAGVTATTLKAAPVTTVRTITITLDTTPPPEPAKDTPTYWLEQGIMLYEEGKFKQALNELNKVLVAHPGHAKASDFARLAKGKLKEVPPLEQATIIDKETASQLFLYVILALGVIGFLILIVYLLRVLQPHQFVRNLRKRIFCPICKAENPIKAEFCHKCGAKLKVWANVPRKQQDWYKQRHWKKNPFTLNALPELFTGHGNQVKWIIEKLHTKSGHILVMGPIGIGKTTLLKWLEMHMKNEVHTLYVSRPPKNFSDLIKLIAEHLRIKTKGKELTIYNIGEHIKKTRKGLVLLLDEAHEFDQDIERHLRTLGDIDEINFVIAGLPETAEKFKKEFPPIYDRLVAELTLKELSLEETKELIKKRIKDAGGHDLEPFTPAAIERIYELSKGIPRATLKTCDWAVTEAIREGHTKIDTPVMI